jgi:hypothetical protein
LAKRQRSESGREGAGETTAARVLFDEVEPAPNRRRVLFARLDPATTTESIVEQVVDLLAETARRMWPLWFTDVSFAECRSDTLGRLAAGVIVRKAAEEIAGLSPSWAEAAVRLALDNCPPRVSGTLPAVELAQLALAISRSGLVLVVDASVARTEFNRAAIVHALEWIAQHLPGSVIALFPELPPNEPPFDRILYGAGHVMNAGGPEPGVIEPEATGTAEAGPWIAP